MKIEILGSGCRNCVTLHDNVVKACKELKIDAEITKVQDFKHIASYGVMATPALVVDGEVKFYGRVPDTKEIMMALKGQ